MTEHLHILGSSFIIAWAHLKFLSYFRCKLLDPHHKSIHVSLTFYWVHFNYPLLKPECSYWLFYYYLKRSFISVVLWALDFCPAQSVWFYNFSDFHKNSLEITVIPVCFRFLVMYLDNAKTIQFFKDSYFGRDILEMLCIWTKVEDFVLLCYNLHYCKF